MAAALSASVTATGQAASSRGVAVLCLGEMLIDFVPEPDARGRGSGLGEARRFVKAAGGAPANVAVAVTKLGAKGALLAAIGDDPFGHFLLRALSDNAVDASAVALVPQQTAVAFVGLSEAGERDFMFYRADAAHDRLSVEQVEHAFESPVLQGAEVLHIGSNTLAAQPAAAACDRSVELATDAGMTVSLDVNLRLPFWDDERRAREALLRLLPRAGLVKLSLEELEFMVDDAGYDRAERFAAGLLAGGARLVCVTLGRGGAWYFTAAGSGSVAAPAVASVDTTGAGDAFAAAIIAAHVAGPSRWADPAATREAVGRACAYGALTTTRRGAIPAYQDAAGLESFITSAGIAW